MLARKVVQPLEGNKDECIQVEFDHGGRELFQVVEKQSPSQEYNKLILKLLEK